MKKIFVFLLLMVASFALKAQYPIQQNLGGDSTIIYIKGAARTVGGFINGTYTDTSAANLTRIRQYQAAQIFTTNDSAIWVRMPGATKWVRIMPATPPSPNGDTYYWSLRGNYVADRVAPPKLGTTTGYELNIITNDSIRLTIPVYGIKRVTGNENRYLVIDTTIGSSMYVGYMDGGSGSSYTAGNGLTLSGSQFKLGSPLTEPTTITGDATNKLVLQGYNASNDGYLNIGQDAGYLQFGSGAFTPSYESEIYSGSLELGLRTSGNIYLNAGDIYTIGVPTVSSTTGRKVALIDTVTGKVERIDPASLTTTPTLQQVITAGSTLTGNNTIDVNNNELMIDLVNTFGIADNSSDARIVFNSGLTKATRSLSGVISGRSSDITLYSDSIVLRPSLSNLYIDSLQTVLTTTGRKVLLHDTATGKVERIDPATLVTTPTLQQVLTAGSTLTTDANIDADGNNITFNNVNEFNINTTTDGVLLKSSAGGKESLVRVVNDSIRIFPHQGILNIDSLRTWSGISDTTYKKPMTWDTRNGRWEYADSWFGGGGGSQDLQTTTDNGNTTTNWAQFGDSLVVEGADPKFHLYGSGFGYKLKANSTDKSLQFINGSNSKVNFIIDENGLIGINTLVPAAQLDVQDADGSIATGIFNAHEDRSGEIVNIQQAGTKKFSFNTTGAIEITEVAAPATPASGYGAIYAKTDGKIYFKNDGGTEYDLTGGGGVTTVGAFSGSSQTNGASISGGTITFGPADGTNPGMVSTGTQTWAGVKTFSSAPTISTLTTRRLLFNNDGSVKDTSVLLYNSNGEMLINTSSDAGDYKLQINGQVYGTKFDLSGGGGVRTNGGCELYSFGTTKVFGSSDIYIQNSGISQAIYVGSAIVINNGSLNADFNVKGDNNANLLYADASADAIGVNTNTPNSLFDVAGSLGTAITTTSTNLTLDDTHYTVIVTSGTPTITLPAAASGNSRRIYVIVNQTGSGVTISSYLDFTGAGNTTVAANSAIKIQSNGTNWYRIL